MSEKLPDTAGIRGLGDPMFFHFNIEPKSKVLISHAAIMATFILPPDAKMKLCEIDDDPRLPHFVDFMKRNKIIKCGEAIDELDKIIAKQRQELKDLQAEIHQLKSKP